MKTARMLQIVAEGRAEKAILIDAMDMVRDLADPELVAVVEDFDGMRDALRPATGTGLVTLHVNSAKHLCLALDMLRDWANDLTPDDLKEDPTAVERREELPMLTAMFNALKAELESFGVTL